MLGFEERKAGEIEMIEKFKTIRRNCLFKLSSSDIVTICIALLINLNLPSKLKAQKKDVSSSMQKNVGHNIKFDRISLEQGLSQTTVWAIIQDSRGFMWFGTADGLNKFDGYNFTVYNHDPLDSTSISDSRVITICEDKDGTLWIGTAGGLNKFNRESETFTHYIYDLSNPNSLSDNRVQSIYEDRSGILWIGTDNGGLNKFDKETEKFEHYQYDPANPNSLSHNHIFPICEDKTGVLWIGTPAGLNRFDKENKIFKHYKHDPSVPNSLSHNEINALYEDKSGTLWIGTDNGLNKLVPSTKSGQALSEADWLDPAKIKFVHYKHDPMNPNSLSDDMIWSIFEDKSGNLWIGTAGGGLNKFEKEKDTFIHYKNNPIDPNTLSDYRVRSIYEDRSGLLWIGTHAGGLNKFNRYGKKFVHYKMDPANLNSLSNNSVRCIYQDKSGILWIGTWAGGLNKFDRENENFKHYRNDPSNPHSIGSDRILSIHEDKLGVLWIGTVMGLDKFDREREIFVHYKKDPSKLDRLSENSVRVIFEDKIGALWIGMWGGGFNKFDRKKETFTNYSNDPKNVNSLCNNTVMTLYENRYGTLWIGTCDGLDRFDREKDIFEHYNHDPANSKSLSNNYILSIYEDPAENGYTLWIGTQGGLNKLVLSKDKEFKREKEEFTIFTENDGLPNNWVYGILGDDHGNLWLSTNKGISKFNTQTETFRNYDVNDGLQSNEFNTGAYFISSSGEMFFGGNNGFNAFYPDSIKDNSYIPPVVITTIKKFDEIIKFDISDTEEIELSYKDKYLAFEFASLDYTNPQKNQYAYIMEGFDKDWIDAGMRRRATYTNLNPGKYIFRVKGSNSDGVWNEEGVSVKIVITPPFWETWWFIFLSVISVLVIGYILYRQNVKAKMAPILGELKAAHDTQMGLMPKSDPIIEGFDISGVCKPAEAVGGDFFDYIWVDEEKTKLGIAIVDVSEKAMKGAMNAVMTSGMVDREVGCGESPRLFLQKINRAQYLKTEPHVFTSMLYGVLDINSKTFTVSNAGHPQPILKRNGKIMYIKSERNHFPLGVQEDVKYTEKTIILQKGDMLVCYTDGLPEAMDERNELFDFEGIERTIQNVPSSITASEAIENLLSEVEKFTGKTKQHDDITIVVVKLL